MTTSPRAARLPEIDWLKGLAILWVVCIHAKLGASTFLYEYTVNRAVPIFLVLFGVTSEFWWRRSLETRTPSVTTRMWYASRFGRLVPPFWAMAAVWWAFVLRFDGRDALHLGVQKAAATFAGYAPWIGTSWFVTVVFQLVVVFPALRWLWLRGGARISLALMAALSAVCVWYLWSIVEAGRWLFGNDVPEPGWYYFWIFSPRVFWQVASGVFIARRWGGRPSRRISLAMAAITLLSACVAVAVRANPDDPFYAPLKQQTIQYLADVPLAIALLGAFVHVPTPEFVRRSLSWCGTHSWGIYLGHLLVHEVLHLRGIAPETGPELVRALYALFLFVCGAGLAAVGSRFRKWISRRS